MYKNIEQVKISKLKNQEVKRLWKDILPVIDWDWYIAARYELLRYGMTTGKIIVILQPYFDKLTPMDRAKWTEENFGHIFENWMFDGHNKIVNYLHGFKD